VRYFTSRHVRANIYSNVYSKNMMAGAPSLQLPRLRVELFQQLVKERDEHDETGDSSQASS
jgi:hypothetical protein